MSMLDSFFNKGFKGSKCKTCLKLTIPRIKLLRNRRELQLKQMRKDIAKLLETGQEATARIRVEHIVREENMMAAQEIIELFCELIAVRLPIIETQRECPLDLKEAISSICFAAPRCADLPELQQVQMAFVSKYGREFVAAATELMPDCGVNRQLVELLSVRAPSPEKKFKLLKEIAEEHELDWDLAPSETELFKSHEDLLNGPNQFVSGSKVPLPKEKDDDVLQSTSGQGALEHSDSEDSFDEMEFPEVPKVSLRPSVDTEVTPLQPSAPNPEHHVSETHIDREAGSFHQSKADPEHTFHSAMPESPKTSANLGAAKQFVPFICPPSMSSAVPPLNEGRRSPEPFMASHSMSSTSPPVNESKNSPEPFISPPSQSSMSPPVRESSQSSNLARTKSNATVDLNDVLAAAKAAADSAERAAAAARSAASLAEIRISELIKSQIAESSDNFNDNLFHSHSDTLSAATEKLHLNEKPSEESDVSNPFSPSEYRESNQTVSGLNDDVDFNNLQESSPQGEDSSEQGPPYNQPHRIPSMDDDYFSYPNLFNSQSGISGSNSHSPDK